MQLEWNSVIYLAVLSNINPKLYKTARIDGANRLQQMRYVTVPGIMPTVMVLLILNIGSLMAVGFEKILLLYNPQTYETADVISTFLYRMGLTMNNYSYGAAIGLFESLTGAQKAREVTGEDVEGFGDIEATIKSAIMAVSALPIIMVYPFVQKYFVRGIMIGSLEG